MRIVALSSIAALVVGFAPVVERVLFAEEDRTAQVELDLLYSTQGFGRIVHNALLRDDVIELERITSIIVEDQMIDAALILAADGSPRAHYGPGLEIQTDPDFASLFQAGAGTRSIDGETVRVQAVRSGDFVIGTVALRARHANYAPPGGFSHMTDVLVIFSMVILLAPLIFLMSKCFLKPLKGVAAAIREIKPGNATHAVSLARGVSDDLGAAIEEMSGRYDKVIYKSRKLAISDALTGLANRAHFMRLAQAAVEESGERSTTLAILDIDDFNRVNELLGPRKADQLLRELGGRLKDALGTADKSMRAGVFETAPSHIGRLGADQFAFIIPFVDSVVSERIMKVMASVVSQPFDIDGRRMDLTATCAAAIAPKDAKTAMDLLKQAELALKKAKETHASGLNFFTPKLLEEKQNQMRLEEEIRLGVERGEFIAVFQPKVELETGEIVGAEALARWRRPDGAVVSPGVFIPKAEEMGLISQLGVAVLRDACMEAASWKLGKRSVRIAVNVSPLQFEDPDFIPLVYEILDESGLEPEMLELELTESAAVENPQKVARIMRPLRAKGVRLAIDDFGTGHSNFTTVTRLPFDVFKIDQQFVKALKTDPHAPAIIEMILAMAETLGQETVAEGVETAEQCDFLRRRACTIGQGYYFSPPLPGHEFQSFVNHWRTSSVLKRSA